MTVHVCDKCKQVVDSVEPVGEQWGKEELCKPCMDRINEIVVNFKIQRNQETEIMIMELWRSWIGAPKEQEKQKWYKFSILKGILS
jgi:hypothetical protein